MAEPLVSRSVNPADRYGLPMLEELLHRPPWHADAACKEHPDVDWFAEFQRAAAESICRRCLVRVECAGAGIKGYEHGLWGGLDRRERRRVTLDEAA